MDTAVLYNSSAIGVQIVPHQYEIECEGQQQQQQQHPLENVSAKFDCLIELMIMSFRLEHHSNPQRIASHVRQLLQRHRSNILTMRNRCRRISDYFYFVDNLNDGFGPVTRDGIVDTTEEYQKQSCFSNSIVTRMGEEDIQEMVKETFDDKGLNLQRSTFDTLGVSSMSEAFSVILERYHSLLNSVYAYLNLSTEYISDL